MKILYSSVYVTYFFFTSEWETPYVCLSEAACRKFYQYVFYNIIILYKVFSDMFDFFSIKYTANAILNDLTYCVVASPNSTNL